MVSMLETKSTVVSSYGTNSIQYLLLDDAKGRITMEYDAADGIVSTRSCSTSVCWNVAGQHWRCVCGGQHSFANNFYPCFCLYKSMQLCWMQHCRTALLYCGHVETCLTCYLTWNEGKFVKACPICKWTTTMSPIRVALGYIGLDESQFSLVVMCLKNQTKLFSLFLFTNYICILSFAFLTFASFVGWICVTILELTVTLDQRC